MGKTSVDPRSVLCVDRLPLKAPVGKRSCAPSQPGVFSPASLTEKPRASDLTSLNSEMELMVTILRGGVVRIRNSPDKHLTFTVAGAL